VDLPDLPPHVREQRRRVEGLAGSFVGLTAEQARSQAQEHDVHLRVLHEGDMMTADFRPTRLNALLDAADRVQRTWLG
jgi:hypothetical protein